MKEIPARVKTAVESMWVEMSAASWNGQVN